MRLRAEAYIVGGFSGASRPYGIARRRTSIGWHGSPSRTARRGSRAQLGGGELQPLADSVAPVAPPPALRARILGRIAGRNQRPAPVNGNDGLMAVVIGLAAAKSARENRPVKLTEIYEGRS